MYVRVFHPPSGALAHDLSQNLLQTVQGREDLRLVAIEFIGSFRAENSFFEKFGSFLAYAKKLCLHVCLVSAKSDAVKMVKSMGLDRLIKCISTKDLTRLTTKETQLKTDPKECEKVVLDVLEMALQKASQEWELNIGGVVRTIPPSLTSLDEGVLLGIAKTSQIAFSASLHLVDGRISHSFEFGDRLASHMKFPEEDWHFESSSDHAGEEVGRIVRAAGPEVAVRGININSKNGWLIVARYKEDWAVDEVA